VAESLLDHQWVFDARYNLNRTTALLTGFNVDVKNPFNTNYINSLSYFGIPSKSPGNRYSSPVIRREIFVIGDNSLMLSQGFVAT
jgi:hypothetical protein